MPAKKGEAYRRLQARNKAKREAFEIAPQRDDEQQYSQLRVLDAYIHTILDHMRTGYTFMYARWKEITPKTRRINMRTYEIRNRGRQYIVTIEDRGPITGISPLDYEEWGGPGPDDVDTEDAGTDHSGLSAGGD